MVRNNIKPDRSTVKMSTGGPVFHPQIDISKVNVHLGIPLEKIKPARGGKLKLSANTWVRGAPKCLQPYIT